MAFFFIKKQHSPLGVAIAKVSRELHKSFKRLKHKFGENILSYKIFF